MQSERLLAVATILPFHRHLVHSGEGQIEADLSLKLLETPLALVRA